MDIKEIRCKCLVVWFFSRILLEKEKSYFLQLINGKVLFGERVVCCIECDYGMVSGYFDEEFMGEEIKFFCLFDVCYEELFDFFDSFVEWEKEQYMVNFRV